MDKWKFAAQHGCASIFGILRVLLTKPGFAVSLFTKRLRYFLTRRFQPLMTPDGFLLDTPDTLIAYWSMFVERELFDRNWFEALAAEPTPLVIDVGANAGVFSHYVYCLHPGSQIVAFEPLPAMVDRIRALQKRTGMDLICHQQAVSKSSGEALFESPHGYDGISRFASEGAKGENVFRVETTTLDAVLAGRKPVIIKIDVEGFECDVIEGGRQVLANSRFLIIEAQTEEHLAKITRTLGAGWKRKKLGSSDYLFSRVESASCRSGTNAL